MSRPQLVGPLVFALALASSSAARAEAVLTATTANTPAPSVAAPPARVTAEFGRGVSFVSEDDSLSLTLRGRIQSRFSHAEELRPGTRTDGFQIRRMRLTLEGHALTRELRYRIQLAFSNLDQEPDLRTPLRDAFVTWTPSRDVGFWVGQGKVSFDRQRMVSSGNLQLVDRSIVTGELNLDRDVGVQIRSKDLFGLGGRIGYQLGLFGGDGRNRIATAAGLLYVARVELRPLGAFEDEVEADIDRTPSPKLTVALAGAYNADSNRARSTFEAVLPGRTDYRHAAADMIFKWAGFSLQSEVMYRRAVAARVGPEGQEVLTRSGWGWFAQAGYMVTDHLEVAGRYGDLMPIGESALTRQREAGGGLSWYFDGHDLKLQSDYFFLFGDQLADGQHQARVQLQIHF